MHRLYWTLFSSFFFVLPLEAEDRNFQCPEDFCSDENTVCYNFQCLNSCPIATYVFKNNCVSKCPNGFYTNGNECTRACPSNKPLIQDGHCQSQCTNGRIQSNGTCVIGCPTYTYLFNNSCVEKCPYTYPLTLNSTIITSGQKQQSITKSLIACVNECPDTTVKTTNSCLLQCPDKMILFNRSCVHKCPSSHSIVLIRNSNFNSIPTCVAQCPPNTFPFGKTCVDDCPRDTLISNNTCVKSCSHPFPFICTRGKCTIESRYRFKATFSKGQCLSHCPSNHILLDNSCFLYCSLSRLPYRLNDTCVSQCPKNLSYGYYPHCVDKCPEKSVQYKDRCRSRCPPNTVLANATCYSECPKTYPWKYDFSSGLYWSERKIACVKSCPSGTLVYNKQCVKYCPSDTKAIQNRTCLKNCSDQYPLVCIKNKCDSPYSVGIKQCLSKCPLNHKQYGQECFRHCYDTPLKYLENGTCVNECSKNLSYGVEQRCVDSCPENTYQYNDSCVYICPKHTVHVNRVCYESCPSEYPLKYVIHKTRIYRPSDLTTCRKSCPYGTVKYNHTCISHCPTDWFTFNSSCVKECPSTHPYNYTIFGAVNKVKCVNERPNNAMAINDSFYSACPDNAKFVWNRTCYSSCPINYPFAQLTLLNSQITTECVDFCKDDTLLWNRTCVSSCPSGHLLYKKECVLSCPEDFSVIYVANRKFRKSQTSEASTQKSSYFCSKYCDKHDLRKNISVPCIYRGTKEYRLFENTCKLMEDFEPFESIVQNCTTKALFERNGTFFVHCPENLKQTRRACVDECPFDEAYYDPKLRKCVTICAEKQFTHKNICVEKCPPKTLIKSSFCMDIDDCPSDTPVSLVREEGTYCLKSCPDTHFLDEKKCVKKCTGKKKLGRICTMNCTETHPFIKKEFTWEIPECFQICPDDYLGNMASFECIHDYDCHDFVFNSRCYSKCPDNTITVINGNLKICGPRSSLKIELLIMTFGATTILLFCVLCMCVEKGTPSRCIERLTVHITSRKQIVQDVENEHLFAFDVPLESQMQSEMEVEENSKGGTAESTKGNLSNARQFSLEDPETQSSINDENTELKVIFHNDFQDSLEESRLSGKQEFIHHSRIKNDLYV